MRRSGAPPSLPCSLGLGRTATGSWLADRSSPGDKEGTTALPRNYQGLRPRIRVVGASLSSSSNSKQTADEERGASENCLRDQYECGRDDHGLSLEGAEDLAGAEVD